MKNKYISEYDAEMEIYRSDVLLEKLRNAKNSKEAEDAFVKYFSKKPIGCNGSKKGQYILKHEYARKIIKLWFPEYYRSIT